ncbi:hypothetical protein CLERM_057 [Coxiella-like endosymbiont]|uniref:DUF2797 domain-containing protein n=1 Tax=Coxiella-like endosymbiont TaxID=1592897 RepID=UPI000C80B270|nr:DUF2797 domain-containing protein [Coxiella-like endosymbiont]PMB54647.1 hypothetical protein CLERM_057 [Coxiella-like endosymbiont]
MKINIHLKKLKSILKAPIEYYLIQDNGEILLNDWLGKSISFNYTGSIFCIQCGRKTNQSFQEGFCFPCLRRLQECDLCIIHPERCRIEKEGCFIGDWAHVHCHENHVVYIANSSGLKVGITRKTQVFTRWIDQGAIQGIPILHTKNRYQAGMIEVNLKAFIADRTDWRRMLRNDIEEMDLISARDAVLKKANFSLVKVINQFKEGDVQKLKTISVTRLKYPVLEYPNQIKALSFEKTPTITGFLLGIKGQYLILNTGVINIRKYAGYNVECML